MTATLSIAAQIAQDIREAIKPDFVPACIERRLETIIDANLAGERAKVAELVKAAEESREFIESLLDLTPDAAADHLANNGEGVEERITAALFNLQA